MNEKYEFTGETKTYFGVTLKQIRAIISFGDVAKGDVGGWIESEDNLDVSGKAWVSGKARVFGEARADRSVREREPLSVAMDLAPTAAASGIFFARDVTALEWLKERKYAQSF